MDDGRVRMCVKLMLLAMPIYHSATLAYLLDFFDVVTLNSGANKMTTVELLKCIAPTLVNFPTGENGACDFVVCRGQCLTQPHAFAPLLLLRIDRRFAQRARTTLRRWLPRCSST